MTEGLFDRYFRLLAGRLPVAEYGVIADADENETSVRDEVEVAEVVEPKTQRCLCCC